MGRRPARRRRITGVLVPLALLLGACAGSAAESSDPAPETIDGDPSPYRVRLVDVAAERGLDFTHGAFRWATNGDPVAMMGGGLCWLDADGDERLDLYVVNSYAEVESRQWDAEDERPLSRLYLADGDGFRDATRASGAGLDIRGNGCVAADLDLDGATDLFVTSARENVLLWGDGDGGFTEGTGAAGLDAYGWQSGAAVGDVNGDGWPDLFVAGYVNQTRAVESATQGFPNTFEGLPDLLYLSDGPSADGRVTFREVSGALGIDPAVEYGLGALFTDVDDDGDLDLYVANDTNPNRLYRNEPDPTAPEGFTLDEVATTAAVADPNSGMGVAGDDYDGDGRGDLLVTNFGDQTHALFRNRSTGTTAAFADGLPDFAPDPLGIGSTGWGTRFADLDLDTDLDLLVANGFVPITDLEADAQPLEAYGNFTAAGMAGRFEPLGDIVGLDDVGPINGRGLAAADYDNDGDMDVAVNAIGAPLVLLENRGAAGNWLEVAVRPFSPGAVVTVQLADGRELRREVHAGSSYLSSEDPRAHFGLGRDTRVAELRVAWPDGEVTELRDVDANQLLTVDREDP